MDELTDRLPDVAQRDLAVKKATCLVDCKIGSRSKLKPTGAMIAQIHLRLLVLIPPPHLSWRNAPNLAPASYLTAPGRLATRRSCLM
jgi:hypothetical protein